ncbi:hypothetical protein ES703_44099 [subsurface metagenome]
MICILPEKIDHPVFITGMEEKRKWAMEMLRRWGTFARLAYEGSTAVGLIQYKPVPSEKVVYLYCIFVPEDNHLQKGIATKLFSSLKADMKKPKIWFDNKPALALVTRTFAGEKPGQFSARLFFKRMGFKQVGEDPDFLYYPLEEGFIYQPVKEKGAEYIPQEEDKDKVLLVHGPSFCPFSYFFLKKAEQAIKEIAPGISIQWIDKSKEPEEIRKRGNIEGCIVNAKAIKSYVLDKEDFQKEITEALK